MLCEGLPFYVFSGSGRQSRLDWDCYLWAIAYFIVLLPRRIVYPHGLVVLVLLLHELVIEGCVWFGVADSTVLGVGVEEEVVVNILQIDLTALLGHFFVFQLVVSKHSQPLFINLWIGLVKTACNKTVLALGKLLNVLHLLFRIILILREKSLHDVLGVCHVCFGAVVGVVVGAKGFLDGSRVVFPTL